MYLLIRWVVHALILWVVVLVGRHLGLKLELTGFIAAAFTVLLLALANAVIRPILKTLLLPLNCLTFGLLGFAINVLIIWLVSEAKQGFVVGGLREAIYCSVCLSVFGGIANKLMRPGRED